MEAPNVEEKFIKFIYKKLKYFVAPSSNFIWQAWISLI